MIICLKIVVFREFVALKSVIKIEFLSLISEFLNMFCEFLKNLKYQTACLAF